MHKGKTALPCSGHREIPEHRTERPEISMVTRLQGYHVTDDPQIVITALCQGLPIDKGVDVSPHDDLKASGLYFSEAPQLWVSRSIRKWNFAESLTKEQCARIVEAVANESRLNSAWYVTSTEKKLASQYLASFAATGNVLYLQLLAQQPFNIRTWEPGFLSQFGIVNDHVPHQVPVEVEGTFIDISNVTLSPDTVVAWKQAGYDGMFLHPSLVALPQAVVWNNHAIVQFGEYRLHRRDI